VWIVSDTAVSVEAFSSKSHHIIHRKTQTGEDVFQGKSLLIIHQRNSLKRSLMHATSMKKLIPGRHSFTSTKTSFRREAF
jgi:hypothetical protein